jgi:hypothetical protein
MFSNNSVLGTRWNGSECNMVDTPSANWLNQASHFSFV